MGQRRLVGKARRRRRRQHQGIGYGHARVTQPLTQGQVGALGTGEEIGRPDAAGALRSGVIVRIDEQGDVHVDRPPGQLDQQAHLLAGEAGETVHPDARPGEVVGAPQRGAGKLQMLRRVESGVAQVLKVGGVQVGEVGELGGVAGILLRIAGAQIVGLHVLFDQLADGLAQSIEKARQPLDALVVTQVGCATCDDAAQHHGPGHGRERRALGRVSGLEDAIGQAFEAEHFCAVGGVEVAGEEGALHLQAGLLGREQNQAGPGERRTLEFFPNRREAVMRLADPGAADHEAHRHAMLLAPRRTGVKQRRFAGIRGTWLPQGGITNSQARRGVRRHADCGQAD